MDQGKDEEIKQKIKNYREILQPDKKAKIENASNAAFNIAIEIVAGVIAGLIIGLFLDNLFASKPIFLIICLMLSSIAAFRSIWYKYK